MTRETHAVPILTALALLLIVSAPARSEGLLGTSAYPVYVADPGVANSPVLEDRTWVSESPAHMIRLTQLDQRLRQMYIEKMTGVSTDPFAAPPGQEARYLSFLLEVQNRGKADVTLQPMRCWLVTKGNNVRQPVGMSDLSYNYRLVGGEMPPAYEKIDPYLLQQSRIIGPGEAVHGLLVYPPLSRPPRHFRIEVQLILPSGNVVSFAAPYRRPPKEKGDDKKSKKKKKQED